jgi:hypothetical protein
MADQYINRSVDLTTTGVTPIYTVPTASIGTPPIPPTTGLLKTLIVCNDSGGAVTIDFKISDKSLGPADIMLYKTKSIAANTTVELLTQPLVLEEGDILSAQAASGNALHVITAIMEIS